MHSSAGLHIDSHCNKFNHLIQSTHLATETSWYSGINSRCNPRECLPFALSNPCRAYILMPMVKVRCGCNAQPSLLVELLSWLLQG